ncbi:MAG: tRNA (5-methylaminomethyl-2-thiouridine)(34)-methyltransferase MnmD [Pseudomonadota bacterium]
MITNERQKPEITWRAGDVPVSTRFDDSYFALADGLDEARHVYLAGNDLPTRFVPGFQIAELGFGTGLNALAAAQAWRSSQIPGALSYISFEAYPIEVEAMERALSAWPELAPLAQPLIRAWKAGARFIELPGLQLTVVEGDARNMLTHWNGKAHAWFLDGFSPARNPELWEPALMAQVARHTAPGGTFATYSAASAVRRTLDSVGFKVVRVEGFDTKRHMSRGKLRAT